MTSWNLNSPVRRAALLAAGLVAFASPVAAVAQSVSAPVLADPAALAAAGRDAARYPLFAAELARTRAMVDAAMKDGIVVPVPKDPGGGYTHEQHKRNYQAIYGAGLLYRVTGDKAYADYARRMLLAYARLYPTLGPHPAKANEYAGRLFWQVLNDAVWLVYSVQGYDAIRDTLSAQDRQTIDDNVFRPMVKFLSVDQRENFDLIHNHATWACAGVGMTGYVLRDRDMVDRALKGSDKTGKSGFLAQIDQLFSPEGYYTEGPYYQRYALQPFVVFAQAIQANDPGLGIFKYRDGVLLKAIGTTIQTTYDGYFFPLNDAMPDKSLKTDELYQAVAIGYAQTRDPGFLSIAAWQQRTVLTPEGMLVARDLAAGKARPFPFKSALFRDGPQGEQGGVAVMRSSAADDAAVLVAKNSAMGMGHGHFDKLAWIFYDNGNAIVTDYGAARFLNIESKDGGRYLAENESWAKQTVAHNTLVVNETSAFGAKWKVGQTLAPKQLFFSGDGPTKVSTAEMSGAWPGVSFRRTLAMLQVDGFDQPLVVDLLRVSGDKPATYDLPLHYLGQIMEVGFPLASNTSERPVLGKVSGYQHIWVDATGTPTADNATLTWLNGNRFYTYRMLPPDRAQVILGESGANDPRFNLRREPMLIERVTGAKDATFVGVLEPHGVYDASAETTTGSKSRVAALKHVRGADGDVVTIVLNGGRTIILAVADSADPAASHRLVVDGRTIEWKGHFARLDRIGDAR
jgi:hypothetical protein